MEAHMAIMRGDRLELKRTGMRRTAISEESGGSIQVKQDDGLIATWSVFEYQVIAEETPE
jgi:hypothetical protein